MKPVLVLISFLMIGLAGSSSQAQSYSTSTSISCSGQLRGQYFYAYAYQYIYSADGYNITHHHDQIHFQGALGGQTFELVEYDGQHMIYKSADFKLAVPVRDGDSMFYKDLRTRINEHSRNRNRKWLVLCQR